MIDKDEEIRYWREQCFCLKKDVRVLRRELYWKEFCGKDKYDEFKDWVIENHSDVWIVRGIFDAFEKKYNNNGDGMTENKRFIMEKTEDERKAFLIIERAFKKTPLR